MIFRAKGVSYQVEPLAPHHDRSAFSCGVIALDLYLQRQARQDAERKLAAISVLTSDSKSIAGFYTLSANSILASELPEAQAKKLPRFPLPVTLLGRMAVSQHLQGHGAGQFLLTHALDRTCAGAKQIASWAVVVDAKDGTVDFYLKNGFIQLPSSRSRLFLSLATIERARSAS